LILEGGAWVSEMQGRGANERISGLVISYQDTLNVYTYNVLYGASYAYPQGQAPRLDFVPHKRYRVSDSVIPELTKIVQLFKVEDLNIMGVQGWTSFLSFFDRFLKTSLELLENGQKMKEEMLEKSQLYETTMSECKKIREENVRAKALFHELSEYEEEHKRLNDEAKRLNAESERKHKLYLELMKENLELKKILSDLDVMEQANKLIDTRSKKEGGRRKITKKQRSR